MVRGNTAVRAGPTTQANIAAVSLPGEPPKPVLATLSPGFKNSIIRPCTNTFFKRVSLWPVEREEKVALQVLERKKPIAGSSRGR